MTTTVQILGDEVAGLPSGEIGLFAETLVQAHPTAADQLLSELMWAFMDRDLAKEFDNG